MNGIPHRFIIPALLLTLLAMACKQTASGDFVIEHVNIVDVESGQILPDRDVLISANKIISLEGHNERKINAAVVIDGSDKYLIPGLWDMHAHMMREEWYKSQLPILRANGVTGFREMWGSQEVADLVRRQIRSDSLPFFRFINSGHIIDGQKPYWKGAIAVGNTARADDFIDSLTNAHVDFVKVYSFLEPEVFDAVARRCKKNDITFAGHVPHTVWLTEASNAGMKSMEHLYGFLTESCSLPDSAMELMKRSVNAFERGDLQARANITRQFHELVLNHFSPERVRAVSQVLKRNHTYVVPTLAMLRGIYFMNDDNFVNDPRKKYMSKETLAYWNEVQDSDRQNTSEVEWSHKRRRWEIEKEIMRILIAEGVDILVGTDADNPYAFPGFSVHDEMALFVELGMSPLDAIRAATTGPAKFLGTSDSLGAIGTGKLADMVLLEDNPLEDIRNTTRIHAVFANGNLFDKRYIESVLKE